MNHGYRPSHPAPPGPPHALQRYGPPAAGPLRREGDALVATRGTDLGGVCIKCGSPDAPHRRHVNLSKLPPATYLALLLSLPAFVVIALIVRKKSSHWINLCGPCNDRWNQGINETVASSAMIVGAPTAALFTAMAGFAAPTLLLATVGPLIGIGGLVTAARKRLTAKRIDQSEVRIGGVAEAYMGQMLHRPALPPATPPDPVASP